MLLEARLLTLASKNFPKTICFQDALLNPLFAISMLISFEYLDLDTPSKPSQRQNGPPNKPSGAKSGGTRTPIFAFPKLTRDTLKH